MEHPIKFLVIFDFDAMFLEPWFYFKKRKINHCVTLVDVCEVSHLRGIQGYKLLWCLASRRPSLVH